MASILAYIELREGSVTRPSRYAIAEARRVADCAGATVYALLALGELPQTRIDQLAAEVSAAGADRILCVSDSSLSGPALDATHGPLLTQVAERLRPVLFLFPAGGVGTELGPALAVRIGAAYVANTSIELVVEIRDGVPPAPKVLLTRWRAARDGQRQIDLGDFERPVVASLPCGVLPDALGEPYAEVEMIPSPEPGLARPQLLATECDPTSAPETCSALLWSPSGIDGDVRAVLPNPWPAGVAVADQADGICLDAVSPAELYLLAPDPRRAVLPFSPAPGAQVVHVRSKSEGPS
jgi:hypothetical protein